MRFLVDAQLPAALARWLAAAGHEADHASDKAIWDHALRTEAVVISKDEDFAQRRALEGSGPAIVWIRLPNARKRDLLAWFDKALPKILRALERGERLIELV
ncbi:MAG TPA: DUF5615 family PIN-like protein [Methylocystis sp.]|nr:DUF5615 family PIN-like protein [Methylocystis sp.]